MPRKRSTAKAAKSQSPSTQAGEFVREEIEHVRKGEHGARSAKQIIAIGLSKARRAGVAIPPPPGKKAPRVAAGKPNPKRSRATQQALEREGSAAASHVALSRQARSSARKRGPENLHAAAEKAARTKGAKGRHQAAVKASRTRARRGA
ncbi:transcription elongation factor [uncultured Paludibaculum sp.]|uniref:transcription elongation factor n=1 Tax=uncultured Paludibaculum sp. TaxID=1765020 RepID=UPI002AAACA9F|nr:transcription elongation factor [uncultured Paludibaculum sp.]